MKDGTREVSACSLLKSLLLENRKKVAYKDTTLGQLWCSDLTDKEVKEELAKGCQVGLCVRQGHSREKPFVFVECSQDQEKNSTRSAEECRKSTQEFVAAIGRLGVLAPPPKVPVAPEVRKASEAALKASKRFAK